MLRKLAYTLVGFVLFCLPTQAFTITTGGSSVLNQGQLSNVSGVTTVDFNLGAAPTTGIARYSATNNVVIGNSASAYASPPSDTSYFFTVGPTTNLTATITFTQSINYFGFFAGSLDNYNFIDFYSGNTLISTLSGTDIANLGGFQANGNQTLGIYINIYAATNSEVFNRVVLRSTSFAFETDNHAYRIGSTANAPVPEPNPMFPALLTFGLGVLSTRIYKSRIAVENHSLIH